MNINELHPITKDLLNCIQRNAINNKSPHYGNFTEWCLNAEEIESAIRDLVTIKRIEQGENCRNIVLW